MSYCIDDKGTKRTFEEANETLLATKELCNWSFYGAPSHIQIIRSSDPLQIADCIFSKIPSGLCVFYFGELTRVILLHNQFFLE